MKRLALAIVLLFILAGCDPQNLADKYIKDEEGRIFRVKDSLGDLYWLQEVTPEEIKSLKILTKGE